MFTVSSTGPAPKLADLGAEAPALCSAPRRTELARGRKEEPARLSGSIPRQGGTARRSWPGDFLPFKAGFGTNPWPHAWPAGGGRGAAH